MNDNIKQYISSKEWKDKITLPKKLHEVVNKSLDLTIVNIGKEKFNKALKEHKYLMSLVDKHCAPKAIFPCSKDGVHQYNISKKNCYAYDSGCGFRCIDQLYKQVSKMIFLKKIHH